MKGNEGGEKEEKCKRRGEKSSKQGTKDTIEEDMVSKERSASF